MSVDYEALWSSQRWGNLQDVGPVHRHSARLIVDLVRPLGVRSVIDVGCGTGVNLLALQQVLGLEDVTGVDVSPTAIEVARQRVKGEFSVLDVVREQLPPRRFDLVLSAQVIEHIEDDDAFLAKLRSVCGRYCLVATVQGRMRPSEVLIGHLRNYTRAGLTAKMERAGFEAEKVTEWGFPFYSPLYRSAIELLGGESLQVGQRRFSRLAGTLLYQLYRLNSARRGDILMVLGRLRES